MGSIKNLLFVATASFISVAAAQSGICTGPEAYRQADGRDYRGTVNTTISGISCQKWSVQVPHGHGTTVPDVVNGIGDHNYCRNPTGAPYAGCYTTDPSVRFERCDIGRPCTAPITRVPNSVTFTPESGAEILETGTIAVSCLPKPCEIFYTIDGSEPTIESTRYTRPIAAPPALGPFVLKSMTVFNDGTKQIDRGTYTERALAPSTIANLYPPANVIYPKPVLVSVLTSSTDPIMIFLQNETTARLYNGPFWVFATTSVVAVVGDNVLTSTYYVVTSPRLPAFYPSSGTFYGSVQVFFIPTVTREQFYVRINGKPWELVESNSLTIDAVGKTTVDVQSVSVDFPASAIESAVFTIAPTSPPECQPPSGTYNKAVTVMCTIGNSSVPVEQLCFGLSSNISMECRDVSEISLNHPGSYVVTATYYDTKFKPQLAMYTYNMVPRLLEKARAVPCGGNFMNGLIVDASSDDNVTFSFGAVGIATRVEQTGNATAVVSATAGTTASPAIFDVFLHTNQPMETAPTTPTTCTAALYPYPSASSEVLPTQWMLVPSSLNDGNLSRRVANALRSANLSLIQTQFLFGTYLMVRALPHASLSRAYTRRLYNVLVDLANSVSGFVSTETGVIPGDEVREPPSSQSVTNEEKQCVSVCPTGSYFTVSSSASCDCSADGTQAGSLIVSPVFGVAYAYSTITADPSVAKSVEIRLEWLGAVRNVTAKVVLQKFGCGDLGYPLEFVGPQNAVFTPRHAKLYIVCVDEGNGFHEVPSSSAPLLVSMGAVPVTPTLAPCGGTFSAPFIINVSGTTASSMYSVDGNGWNQLEDTITLPMQSFGTRNVVSVVTQYVDPLTGVETIADSFVCIYRFGNPPAGLSQLTYTFDRVSGISADSYTKLEQARVQLTVLGGPDSASGLSFFVANDSSCATAPQTSYGALLPDSSSSSSSSSSKSLRWASDAGFLVEASLNSSLRYSVCVALNTETSRVYPATPSGIALTPLSLLVNKSCGDRCGPNRVCILDSLCGCTDKAGLVSVCEGEPVEEESSTSVGVVLLIIAALGVPMLLGVLLFYGMRLYGGSQPEQSAP